MKIEDIARLANVSKTAVSLALNNKPGISDETRELILKIVRESGYIPRTMVKAEQIYGSLKCIRFMACIKSEIVSAQYQAAPFFTELIHGLEKECRNLGYSLLFSSVETEDLLEEIEKLEKEHGSSGIILLGTNMSPREVQVISEHQPNLVVLDAYFEYLDVDCIVMNNKLGAYTAGNYLIGLGHRKIGYVQSRTRIGNFEARKEGFLSAVTENGLEVSAVDFFAVTPEIETAKKEFTQLLAKNGRSLPTALFCENDYIAIGIVKALQDAGFKIPDDISVIGFDNIPQAMVISPELTTIHVEKEKMGSLAAKRLVEKIETNDTVKIKSIIDTRLIERGSCRKVR